MTSLTEAPLPLDGLLNIQRNYLNDLAQITDRNVAGNLGDIQTRLQQIHQSFEQANASADNTLTHQSSVEDILKKEYDRLMSKKDEIDNIHYGKMRAVELNDSYRKRQMEYIRVLVAIVVAILLYIVSYMLLPETAADILAIIIFVVLFVYCFNQFWEIYKRDNMNHDRLELAPPVEATLLSRGTSAGATAATSATSASGSVCTGEVCCAEGSRWDAPMNRCIIACPTAAAPLSRGSECIAEADCTGNYTKCGQACILKTESCGTATAASGFSTLGEERIRMRDAEVKPYTPFEYDAYAPVM